MVCEIESSRTASRTGAKRKSCDGGNSEEFFFVMQVTAVKSAKEVRDPSRYVLKKWAP
jgi:hypothetical protein